MTVPDSPRQLRPEQFQMPFRSDTSRSSFLSHVSVRQTSPSAMPSSALLVPLKQENAPPQPFEDHEQLFRNPSSGASDTSLMDYDYPCQHPDFSNYQPAAASRPPAPPDALGYAPQLQYPYPECHYVSPEHDPTCPRTLSNLGSGQLSDICFPPGYQFPGQQQGFCFPSHGYQMEFAGRSQSPPADTGFYPTPPSHGLPFRNTPDYHLKQDFGQALYDDRSCLENEQDDRTDDKNEPYAKLIYRALMERPDHTMVLRDIYDWFKRYTDKPKESNTKGWQNSIRHNLSMNGAFQKVEQPAGEDSKKTNMWCLTSEAIREGVKSTTRYRKKEQHKRGSKHSHNPNHRPSAQRQAAGARGGDATKRSTERRQVQQRQQSEQDLFEQGLGIVCDASLNPEDEACSNPYMLAPIHEGPHAPYVYPLRDYMQHDLGQSEASESRCTSLSPAALTPYQSFPQSPMQDQSWGCNTMSDVPSLFAPTTGFFAGGQLGNGCVGLTPSHTPSPSDGGDPPTPANNPGGLDIDPEGHLMPPPPTTFFEVEGAMM
ncbi:forkhead domain-containing protein [Diplodia corticola]|uniref:Forkhead domain-containing protein n=1 Tax=Diplodia corticola TaxID=236234 RepID=A0A1J9RG39_9PEZI|nr:forkhead domain-containing protein [Diplodia corticola]OJD40494.1 forkhead domain-containing protein [Diplodia corticola]